MTTLSRPSSRHRSVPEPSSTHHRYSAPALDGRARPSSWHTYTSFQRASDFFSTEPPLLPDPALADFVDASYATGQIDGLVTPVTQPFMYEPYVQEVFTPLEAMSPEEFETRYAFLNEFSADHPNQSKSSDFERLQSEESWSLPPIVTIPALSLLDWDAELPTETKQTAPPTPDFLPIQTNAVPENHMGQSFLSNGTADSEELVGMGLYDEPSSMVSPILFGGALTSLPYRGSLGKGLKLEESFEPAEESDRDEDGGADAVEQAVQPATQPADFGVLHLPNAAPVLANRSFFLEQDP